MEVERPKKKSKGKKKVKKAKERQQPIDIFAEEEDDAVEVQPFTTSGSLNKETPAVPLVTKDEVPTVPSIISEDTPTILPIITEAPSLNEIDPVQEFRSSPVETFQDLPPNTDLIMFDSIPLTVQDKSTTDMTNQITVENELTNQIHIDTEGPGDDDEFEDALEDLVSVSEQRDQNVAKNETSNQITAVDELTNQITVENELTNKEEMTHQIVTETKVTTAEDVSNSQFELTNHTPVNVELTNQITTEHTTVIPTAPVMEMETQNVLYPRLDSLMAATMESVTTVNCPFTEEDLTLLYPNPQLASNPEFVENFLKESQQGEHPLYELLNQYIKARLALRAAEAKVEKLKKHYFDNQVQIWSIESKAISSNGRCSDGSKVTHSHSYKFAQYDSKAANRTDDNLKQLRIVLQEELSMKSYSSQLARIHIDYYLHQLLRSIPQLNELSETAPVTGYIPDTPPGSMDFYTQGLRDCISVLFMFERKPQKDSQFSAECHHWLNTMISALLRVASLPDHLFIFNHLLRSPPGVGNWAISYLQPLSPFKYEGSIRQVHANNYTHEMTPQEYSLDWKLSSCGYTCGGPITDHWVTMIGTLLQPIIGREEFLSLLKSPPSSIEGGIDRQQSHPWTFVEEDVEEGVIEEEDLMMLKESDFISFFDQFPLSELFNHILGVKRNGQYSAEGTTSHQMLQLIAFCTCLIRLFGTAFSTLRQSRYKEFIKRVGRTIRQIVHYVADHWCNYKSAKLSSGDLMTTLPNEEDPMSRYSLMKLQIEFDQFVLRATQWILTAHKLGAWQFMADMPYSSLSLIMLWKILWTLYHYQTTNRRQSTAPGEFAGLNESGEVTRERRGSVLTDRLDLDHIPENSEDILRSIRSPFCHSQFIDVLMKTYTSEAVFLLTTFVNMARSRSNDSPEEIDFINVIVQEIFQFTQVEEYARDAYSRTGHSLLDTIARVHPFIISTLLEETRKVVDEIGENCILLFKELPLHLWLPGEHDITLIRQWLVSGSLTSSEHLIAKVVISGLNWGAKENEEGSPPVLILPSSLHRDIALSLVEANLHHLSGLPGGWDYNPLGSTISKYASSIRSLLSPDQSDLSSWLWEIVLMLKLHPSQLSLLSILPSQPIQSQKSTNQEQSGAKSLSVYKQPPRQTDALFDRELPGLNDSSIEGFDQLREGVQREGLLAYYVCLHITNIGSDPQEFIIRGLPMLHKLVEQGYYLPVLKILGNITPLMFKDRKMLINEQSFIQLVYSVANADANQVSLKDKFSWSTPSSLILRRLSALITAQLSHCAKTHSESKLILVFWLEVLLAIPTWLKESNILYLLNNICVAAFGNETLEKVILQTFLEQYQLLQPLQQRNRRLISSVTSSVLSIVGQDGGPPSLFNAITHSEYPWLAYYTLCAEQQFEEQEGIWKSLLVHIKKDTKITIDSGLKRTLSDLNHNSSSFNSNHLCIYRWAGLCTTLDSTFPLLPLVWQKFFALYLQRPLLGDSVPERGSLGLRFFASNRAQSIRKSMKSTLSTICRALQQEISSMDDRQGDEEEGKNERTLLVNFLPRCSSYYQMLRLWLEEPRLHEEALYLPSLPAQYDPDRLSRVFQTKQEEWVEFVRVWEVENIIKVMIQEWSQVASYQKSLPSNAEPHDTSPDTAAARIQKRLSRRTEPVPPPPFHLPSPPFSLLSMEVLLSKDALLPTIMTDIGFIAQQGRVFSERMNTLAALDSEYMTGVADLYSNQPRQFHVSVPCTKKFNRNHVCGGPATIVFRFDEMTAHPHWEERLRQNREEHNELTKSLQIAVPEELCKAVARTEHVVGELSKLSQRDSEALSSGVALFYEILKFITSETKQFPPSCQFLTSCIEILGQEFIQRDPSQTATVLQLLLTQRSLGGLLAPLFDPNLCPSDFVAMYPNVCEVAVKEGSNIAFSMLTKFNIPQWLDDFSPAVTDCTKLLEHIFQGIIYCGHDPPGDIRMLLDGYMNHLRKLVNYQFPLLYNKTLLHIIEGTDTCSIVPSCWEDLIVIITSTNSRQQGDTCRLGLQLVQESTQYLVTHYNQKRLFTKETLYEVIGKDFIPSVIQFITILSSSLVLKYSATIELGNASARDALNQCWHNVIDLFNPWLFPLHTGEGSEILSPCLLEHSAIFSQNVKMFVGILSSMEAQFTDYGESVLSLLWSYYCQHLALPSVPDHVLQCYHTHFTALPWQQYVPNLPAMDLMIKLKLNSAFPRCCFVFLGDIFPLFDWKTIAEHYCASSDSALPIQFHITLLQILVMLAAESEVMNKKETRLPELLSDAKSFAFQYVDSKTYQDILSWQKNNCESATVLQTGSALLSALRLLKIAGSYPISQDINQLQLHNDGWEKRFAFMRLVVELVASASQQKDTHTSSYGDIIAFMLQCVVDIVVYEPDSTHSHQFVALIQEILNLFNTCHPLESFVKSLLGHVSNCLSQLPNASFICLPTVTAACRTLVSIPLMVHLIEDTFGIYFSYQLSPSVSTLQLPYKEDGYGWRYISGALTVPETAYKDFSLNCVQESACLTLHSLLLQEFPRCNSIEQELKICSQVVQWCTQLKPKPTEEHKIFLIWEKAINLLLRQVQFGGNTSSIVTHFTTLANLLQRFGEDKATEGLLGAIGLGRKSSYSLEFRLISRALATFIYCQMPLDSSQSTILRVVPHAPGHVKDPLRYQPGTLALVSATKQADQACAGLESLLSNKSYLNRRDYVTYSLEFVNDLQYTLLNTTELLIYLVSNMYPNERCLDALRVLQT